MIMTPEQFVYWLQGFVEINNTSKSPSADQWKVIEDHLKTVFHKVTPTYTNILDSESDKGPLKFCSPLTIKC